MNCNLKNQTHSDVTINSSVPRPTKTCVIIEPWLILAHSPLWTRVIGAIGLFFLAIDARVSISTLTPVTLRQIYTSSSIVTGLGGTFVDIDFTSPSREASWAKTLNTMPHGHAKTTVLAHTVGALHRFALFSSNRAWTIRIHVGRAFDASGSSVLRLEEVLGTLGTRSQSRVRVHARRTFGSASISTRCSWLIGEGSSWTGLTVFVATHWWLSRIAVPRTFQTGDQTRRRVCTVSTNGYTIIDILGTFFSSVRAKWTP